MNCRFSINFIQLQLISHIHVGCLVQLKCQEGKSCGKALMPLLTVSVSSGQNRQQQKHPTLFSPDFSEE